jgi:hypothetical protein
LTALRKSRFSWINGNRKESGPSSAVSSDSRLAVSAGFPRQSDWIQP